MEQNSIPTNDINPQEEAREKYINFVNNLTEIIPKILLVGFLIFISYLTFLRGSTTAIHSNLLVLADIVNAWPHEFGHFFCQFLTQPFSGIIPSKTTIFVCASAGTFGQLLFPISVMTYFFMRKLWYAGFFCLFWIGSNLSHIAIYINDSSCKCLSTFLPSSGGESIHDWNYILNTLGVLSKDKEIGYGVFLFAVTFQVIALILMIGNIILKILNKNFIRELERKIVPNKVQAT